MFGIKRHSGLSKFATWLSAGIVGVAAMLPFAAYIPWVQNKLKDVACHYASEKTGKDISVGNVNIGFPLDVTADDVLVRDENGDTLFKADEVKADVAVKPLIEGKVDAENIELKGGKTQIKTDDGSLDLDASINQAQVKRAQVDLKNNTVDVDDAKVKGGKGKLSYKSEKKKPDDDKSESKPWKVKANKVAIDDIDYQMDMKPTFDQLDAHIDHADAKDVKVDIGENTVDVGSLNVDGADVDYQHPNEADAQKYRKQHPMPPTSDIDDDDNDSPWKVKADNVRLKNGHGTYRTTGHQPSKPGKDLDLDHIEVDDVDVAVDNFETEGNHVKVPVKHVSGKERSGLEVKDASGSVEMNDRGLDLNDVKLKTKGSDIKLDAHVDQDMLDGKPNGKAQLDTDSQIDLNEVEKIVPDARKALKDLPHKQPIKVKAKASGNDKRVDVHNLDAKVPGVGRVKGKGTIYNPTDINRMKADLDTDIDLTNPAAVKQMLPSDARKMLNIPPMKLSGKVQKDGCTLIANNLHIQTGGGTLRGSGRYNTCDQSYDINATTQNFPLSSFLPDYDVKNLTASVKAKGQGFDFTDCGFTWTDADVKLTHARYNGTPYRNLTAHAKLHGGYLEAQANSSNDGCDFDVDAKGTLCDDHYVFTADGDIRDLDLQAMNLYDGICDGKTKFHADGDINLRTEDTHIDIQLNDIDWQLDSSLLVADEATASLHGSRDYTCFMFINEDNYAHLNSHSGIKQLINDFRLTADAATRQYKERWVDIQELKEPMPQFDFDMHMGTDGLVQRYLQQYELDWRDVQLVASNDTTLFLDASAHGISYGDTNIDTLNLHANELNQYLAFNAHMGNRRGTWDEFAQVDIEGGIKGSTIDFLAKQRNIKGETGYHVGCNAKLADDEVHMKFFPNNPIIGYRQWKINSGNFVNLDYRTRLLDAMLKLESDTSAIELISSREQGATTENVQLNIDNLVLEEWTQLIPALDETRGMLNANIDINWDGTNADGDATITIDDFVYQGKREGNITLDADFELDPLTASTRLTAELLADDVQIASIEGSLNDATAQTPLHLNATFDRFPLKKANAFIPGNYVWVNGFAKGDILVTGETSNPIINGTLTPDSATINLPRYGSSLKLADTPIPIENSYINFNQFVLKGLNDENAVINGFVDFKNLDDMVIDLTLNGRNIQFMDSEQQDFSQIFGKAFADVYATVKSRNQMMAVRADATLLTGSNITYVMKDDISSLSSSADKDMVTFTDFRDETPQAYTLVTAKAATATDIIANITVQDGAKITVFLNEAGENKAIIDGNGKLRYKLDFAGRDNLTGTYNIESGNLRYTPPLIAQKTFDINSGSTLVWSGDMLNPQLNLTGTEKIKTSVTGDDDEGTRLVEFLITATVGGTLNNIDLKFDLESESDMTVQNELQSMSDNQRSQAAINLLLYNTYSGTNSAGVINNLTASAALFSFLQSTLNSWAAKALPGVDLSFGINQFEGTQMQGTQTAYSYRLAKSLFNDRFKIVVGGEYNTDATEDQFANNLFSDIALEYNINPSASRVVRLFRHTGYENVLEGQISETGVSYVLKQKLSNLKNLFSFKLSREYQLRDSLEKVQKEMKKLQEGAIDAISEQNQSFVVPLDQTDSTQQTTSNNPSDKPVVTRKQDDESK